MRSRTLRKHGTPCNCRRFSFSYRRPCRARAAVDHTDPHESPRRERRRCASAKQFPARRPRVVSQPIKAHSADGRFRASAFAECVVRAAKMIFKLRFGCASGWFMVGMPLWRDATAGACARGSDRLCAVRTDWGARPPAAPPRAGYFVLRLFTSRSDCGHRVQNRIPLAFVDFSCCSTTKLAATVSRRSRRP